MFTIFRYSLTRFRGAILGWGLSLAGLGIYVVSLYDTILNQNEQFQQLLKAYPPEMMAAFGDATQMGTPSGYLQFTFFSYAPLIVGFFALLAGSALLVADEEKGTLDLVLAHPITRTAMFWGRVTALVISMAAFLLLAWLGFLVLLPNTQLGLNAGEMLLPFISLFANLVLFGSFALLLSLVLPSHRLAGTVTALVLIASFIFSTLVRLDPELEKVSELSPLNYYQGGLAVDGMDWGWFAGQIGFAVLFLLVAWWRFERRDIRVTGEGSWQLPFKMFWNRKLRAIPGNQE